MIMEILFCVTLIIAGLIAGQFVIKPQNQYARIGESVLFKCTVVDAGKVGHFQEWKEYITSETGKLIAQNDKVLSGKESYKIEDKYNLRIVDVRINNAGKYGCNDVDTRVATVQLIVLESDSVLSQFPQTIHVLESTFVRYWCTIPYKGFWAPQMKWRGFKSGPIQHMDESTTNVVRTFIDVKAASYIDGENYECVTNFGESLIPIPGENEADNIPLFELNLTSLSLNVYYSPKNVSLSDQDGNIVTSISHTNTTTLNCMWDSNPSDATLKWIHIEAGTILGERNSLSITTDLSMGYAHYTIQCLVSNVFDADSDIIGQSSAEVSVHVTDNADTTTGDITSDLPTNMNSGSSERADMDSAQGPTDNCKTEDYKITTIVLGVALPVMLIVTSVTICVKLRRMGKSVISEQSGGLGNIPSQYIRPENNETAVATSANAESSTDNDASGAYSRNVEYTPTPSHTYIEMIPYSSGYLEPHSTSPNSRNRLENS